MLIKNNGYITSDNNHIKMKKTGLASSEDCAVLLRSELWRFG